MRNLVLGTVLLLSTMPVHAQPQSSPSGSEPPVANNAPPSAQMLQESADFRVRVQAALALGASGDLEMRPYVERALWDGHPAVRSSAAAALADLESVESLRALRQVLRQERSPVVRADIDEAVRDLEAVEDRRRRIDLSATNGEVGGEVRWRGIRQVVFLDAVRNDSRIRGGEIDTRLRWEVANALAVQPDVVVLCARAPLSRRAQRYLRRGRLQPLTVQVTVTQLSATRTRNQLRVRCALSVVLQDRQRGVVRSMIQGRATSEGTRRESREAAQRVALAHRAVSGAVESAFSDVGSIFRGLRSSS